MCEYKLRGKLNKWASDIVCDSPSTTDIINVPGRDAETFLLIALCLKVEPEET